MNACVGRKYDLRVVLARCWSAFCVPPIPLCLAQEKYPSRPLKIIVPLPPGGAIDVFVRALGKEFENRTGGVVMVENRAGANTIIAANACKSAAPDGYTICLLTRTTVSINPELYKKLSTIRSRTSSRSPMRFFGQQIVILNKNVPVEYLCRAGGVLQEEPGQAQLRLDGARRRLRTSSWNG